MRYNSDKHYNKAKQNVMFHKLFPKFMPFIRKCGKLDTARQATDDYGVCVFHAGYLMLQTHTHNM